MRNLSQNDEMKIQNFLFLPSLGIMAQMAQIPYQLFYSIYRCSLDLPKFWMSPPSREMVSRFSELRDLMMAELLIFLF